MYVYEWARMFVLFSCDGKTINFHLSSKLAPKTQSQTGISAASGRYGVDGVSSSEYKVEFEI